MKVSMDGLRKNLAAAYRDAVGAFNTGDTDSLRKSLLELRSMVGAMMRVYSDEPGGEFSDLTDLAEMLPFPND